MTTDTRLSALDGVLDEALATATTERGVVGRIIGAVQGAPSESDISKLGDDLSAVVDALESSPSLRRAVTDPAPQSRIGSNWSMPYSTERCRKLR